MSKIEQMISNNNNLLDLFEKNKKQTEVLSASLFSIIKKFTSIIEVDFLDAFFSRYDKVSRHGNPVSDEIIDYGPKIPTDIKFLRELVKNGFNPEKDNLNLYFFKMCLDIEELTQDEVIYLNKIAYIKNEFGISPMNYVMINLDKFIYRSSVFNVAKFIEKIDTNQYLYQDKSLVSLLRKLKIDVIADKAALSIMEKRVGDASVTLKEASHERKQVRSI